MRLSYKLQAAILHEKKGHLSKLISIFVTQVSSKLTYAGATADAERHNANYCTDSWR